MSESRIQIVTIEYEGEPCLFREPRLPDLVNVEAERVLQAEFPDMARYHAAIILLAACYIPDVDEKGFDMVRFLAELARDNNLLFALLLNDFKTAFASSPMWDKQGG